MVVAESSRRGRPSGKIANQQRREKNKRRTNGASNARVANRLDAEAHAAASKSPESVGIGGAADCGKMTTLRRWPNHVGCVSSTGGRKVKPAGVSRSRAPYLLSEHQIVPNLAHRKFKWNRKGWFWAVARRQRSCLPHQRQLSLSLSHFPASTFLCCAKWALALRQGHLQPVWLSARGRPRIPAGILFDIAGHRHWPPILQLPTLSDRTLHGGRSYQRHRHVCCYPEVVCAPAAAARGVRILLTSRTANGVDWDGKGFGIGQAPG